MRTGDLCSLSYDVVGVPKDYDHFSIYDLTLPDLPLIAMHEAHEAEVMCLEYSDLLTSKLFWTFHMHKYSFLVIVCIVMDK